MAFPRLRMLLPAALALAVVGGSQELVAQAGGAPPGSAGAFPARFAPHPYTSALGAVWNYQSCGVRARAAEVAALNAALQAGEAAARAKGLGPELERVRRDYQALLAVSTMMACTRGPATALASARRAVADFRRWVTAQPGRASAACGAAEPAGFRGGGAGSG